MVLHFKREVGANVKRPVLPACPRALTTYVLRQAFERVPRLPNCVLTMGRSCSGCLLLLQDRTHLIIALPVQRNEHRQITSRRKGDRIPENPTIPGKDLLESFISIGFCKDFSHPFRDD